MDAALYGTLKPWIHNKPRKEAFMENTIISPQPVTYGNSSSRAYDVISIMAYLIGVQKQHFEHDYESPLQ